MSHLLVGPLADIPKQICLKSLENFCLVSYILSSLILSSGCVDIISPNSFSVKILADVTILSFFLNKGYWEIFFIPAILQINKYLKDLFLKIGIKLVDFKLEFGRLNSQEKKEIVLADEISPDNCRLWNEQDNVSLDKDLFRQSKGDIKEAYIEVANRLGVLTQKVSSELSENKLSHKD